MELPQEKCLPWLNMTECSCMPANSIQLLPNKTLQSVGDSVWGFGADTSTAWSLLKKCSSTALYAAVQCVLSPYGSVMQWDFLSFKWLNYKALTSKVQFSILFRIFYSLGKGMLSFCAKGHRKILFLEDKSPLTQHETQLYQWAN